jgi:hypothetical protein
MSVENRLQQLVSAGVAENPGAFSNEAKKVISSLSDEEFAALLSIRQKIGAISGTDTLQTFDAQCLSIIL